ncbi:hypothetical protein BT69DRAFT_475868 [Atractiella rhizophila]|nr:hypothetical protein BT69DRAFT_475868 [Atractiella rhizophila]
MIDLYLSIFSIIFVRYFLAHFLFLLSILRSPFRRPTTLLIQQASTQNYILFLRSYSREDFEDANLIKITFSFKMSGFQFLMVAFVREFRCGSQCFFVLPVRIPFDSSVEFTMTFPLSFTFHSSCVFDSDSQSTISQHITLPYTHFQPQSQIPKQNNPFDS